MSWSRDLIKRLYFHICLVLRFQPLLWRPLATSCDNLCISVRACVSQRLRDELLFAVCEETRPRCSSSSRQNFDLLISFLFVFESVTLSLDPEFRIIIF